MKSQTSIDTLAIRIDYNDEAARTLVLNEILTLLQKEKLHLHYHDHRINENSNFYIREYQLRANNRTVVTIRAGSYSVKDTNNIIIITTYYIAITFAGLKSHLLKIDIFSNTILFKVCAYLNTRYVSFKVTALDISLDLYTKYGNILALCTNKSPKTGYYTAYEQQPFLSTSYIEKIPHYKAKDAVQRAYLYDKASKESLPFPLTRFEVKLQSKFFSNNRQSLQFAIAKALNKYHVMYVANKKEKHSLMAQYDNTPALRQRDIKRLGLDSYRCYPDMAVIVAFINDIYTVNESVLLRSLKID